jgi:hypothetical protein
MREIDRRSKVDRRKFLKTAAAVPPATAVAVASGLPISSAWAEEAKALKPETMKTLARVARDIYPHDHLGDHFYIAAVMPWDGKAASDPKTKALIEDGVARLNDDALAQYKSRYADVAWEEQRVALLRGIEHTEFFGTLRGDLIVSLYNNHDVWPKFGYEGSSAEHGGYINRGFNDINWLSNG